MIETRVLAGEAVTPWLEQVAALRIAVFRDWPYLYQGDPDYEARYLARYARSPGSVFVLALDAGAVVGASTGMPLDEEDNMRLTGLSMSPHSAEQGALQSGALQSGLIRRWFQ